MSNFQHPTSTISIVHGNSYAAGRDQNFFDHSNVRTGSGESHQSVSAGLSPELVAALIGLREHAAVLLPADRAWAESAITDIELVAKNPAKAPVDFDQKIKRTVSIMDAMDKGTNLASGLRDFYNTLAMTKGWPPILF
jgi:hypothetical protein